MIFSVRNWTFELRFECIKWNIYGCVCNKNLPTYAIFEGGIENANGQKENLRVGVGVEVKIFA